MSDQCVEKYGEKRCTKEIGHEGVHYADTPWGRSGQFSAGVAWTQTPVADKH